MEDNELSIGTKVVPISKSIGSTFKDYKESRGYTLLKETGYLEVLSAVYENNRYIGRTKLFYLGLNKTMSYGVFLSKDLVLYAQKKIEIE